ncbi:MAG: DUF4339 domain-containing protein [Bacteroidaceae bacterium]|nr:DUF4339 domain-containing protein [Bacteroidaceae bacterium]MBP3832641.1 DUF4339 domain-containing protein [Bacteroidaceae bacterium]
MNEQSFFSIDRLVEFGLSMGIAQQMVGMMNQYMQSMYVPGSIQSMPKPITQVYYVSIDNQQVGPLNDSELSQLINQKKINKDTLAWVPGMMNWEPIEKVPAILKVIALTPPPLNL